MGSTTRALGVACFAASTALLAGTARANGEEPLTRETLLRGHALGSLEKQDEYNVVGILTMISSAGIATLCATRWEEDPPLYGTCTVTLGATAATMTTGIVLGEDARDAILPLGLGMFGGFGFLGFGLSEDRPWEPRLAAFGFVGAVLGTNALVGVNLFGRYGTMRRLRTHRARLESKKPLSSGELAAIEKDYLATDAVLPPWVVALPGLAGAGVVLASVFVGSATDRDRGWAALGGCLLLGVSIWHAVGTYDVQHYRSAVAQLNVGFGPSGLLVQGAY